MILLDFVLEDCTYYVSKIWYVCTYGMFVWYHIVCVYMYEKVG